jgi:hypothetical protein
VGFNKRKMEDARRQEAEKGAAARRATDSAERQGNPVAASATPQKCRFSICLHHRARRSRNDGGIPQNDRADWGSLKAPVPDPHAHAAALDRL